MSAQMLKKHNQRCVHISEHVKMIQQNAEFRSNLLLLCYNFVIIYTADQSVLAADTIVSACGLRGSRSVCSILCNLVSEEARFWVVLCNH